MIDVHVEEVVTMEAAAVNFKIARGDTEVRAAFESKKVTFKTDRSRG